MPGFHEARVIKQRPRSHLLEDRSSDCLMYFGLPKSYSEATYMDLK